MLILEGVSSILLRGVELEAEETAPKVESKNETKSGTKIEKKAAKGVQRDVKQQAANGSPISSRVKRRHLKT